MPAWIQALQGLTLCGVTSCLPQSSGSPSACSFSVTFLHATTPTRSSPRLSRAFVGLSSAWRAKYCPGPRQDLKDRAPSLPNGQVPGDGIVVVRKSSNTPNVSSRVNLQPLSVCCYHCVPGPASRQLTLLLNIMRNFLTSLAIAGACLSPVLAQSSSDPLQEYTISAENITATFIGYGARLTSMVVKDRDGQDTEVAVGYDDPSRYIQDTETNHTYFGEFLPFPERIPREFGEAALKAELTDMCRPNCGPVCQ